MEYNSNTLLTLEFRLHCLMKANLLFQLALPSLSPVQASPTYLAAQMDPSAVLNAMDGNAVTLVEAAKRVPPTGPTCAPRGADPSAAAPTPRLAPSMVAWPSSVNEIFS